MESYGSSWPHDRVKGHTANSKKVGTFNRSISPYLLVDNFTTLQMAQAGFVFSPQGTEDDTATCFYCGTSLSGWEDGDDPLYVPCLLIALLLTRMTGKNTINARRSRDNLARSFPNQRSLSPNGRNLALQVDLSRPDPCSRRK